MKRAYMSTRHAATTCNGTTTIRSSNLKLVWSIDIAESIRVVLADNRKAISNAIVLFELIHNLGPNSVLAPVHEAGLADQVHTMLSSRQQDVGAVGRLEKANRSRGVDILSPHVATDQRDDNHLYIKLMCNELE